MHTVNSPDIGRYFYRDINLESVRGRGEAGCLEGKDRRGSLRVFPLEKKMVSMEA